LEVILFNHKGYIWYDSEARVLITRENGRTDYTAFDWGDAQQARVNEHDMTAVVGDGARYYGFDQQTDRFYGLAYTPPGLETPKVLWHNLSSSVSQYLKRIMVHAVDDAPLLNGVNTSGQVVNLGDTPTEALVAKPLPSFLTPSSGTVNVSVTKWETVCSSMTINFEPNMLSAVTVMTENLPKDSQFEYHIEPGKVKLSLASLAFERSEEAESLNSKTLHGTIRFQVAAALSELRKLSFRNPNRSIQTESKIQLTKLRFNDILLPERQILCMLIRFMLLRWGLA
jgi:hypothetical protein